MDIDTIIHNAVISVYNNSREHYDLQEYFLVNGKYTFVVSMSMWDNWEKSEPTVARQNAQEALEKMIRQQIRTQTDEEFTLDFTLEREMSGKVAKTPKKKSYLQKMLCLK